MLLARDASWTNTRFVKRNRVWKVATARPCLETGRQSGATCLRLLKPDLPSCILLGGCRRSTKNPKVAGVGSKMKNMSARPYNPVHCTWQGQRNKFSWLSLLQRCASKLNLGMGHEAIKFEMIRSFSPTSGGLCIFGPIHSWVLPVVVVITWSAQQGEGHGRMDHIWEPQYQAVPSVPRTILRWAVLPARCLELMLYAPRKQSYNSFKDFYEAGLSWLGLKRSRKGGKFRRVVRTLISRTSCSCAFTCAWFIQPIIPLLP